VEDRFQDNRTYLSGFSDEFTVVCPECGGRAVVFADTPKFVCSGCGKSRVGSSRGWQGISRAEIRKTCSRCNESFSQSMEMSSPRPAKLDVACPNCEAVYSFSLYWEPVGDSELLDPYFGNDLWYKMSCLGHMLWAYNSRHLEFLRDFVSSPLRQREPNFNQSLASRLPKWITSSKNRGEVLKCIDRLEKGQSI